MNTRANKRKLPVLPLVVAAIVVLGVAAAIIGAVSGGDDSSEVASGVEQIRPVAVEGSALPPLGEGDDPAVGQRAPLLEGLSFDGSPVAIDPTDGTAKLVIFVAHWCPHCQAEVPRLVDHLAASGMPAGVRLVALSTSINRAQPNYPPSAWLEREGWTVPTLTDDASSSALTALGMANFPGFVFVDADGRVASRMTGELPMETFAAAVDAIAP